jgi:hypothetical protein
VFACAACAVWDKLFGTFEPEGEEAVYGITTPTTTVRATCMLPCVCAVYGLSLSLFLFLCVCE